MSIKFLVVIAAITLFGIAILSKVVKTMTLMIIMVVAALLGLLLVARLVV